MKLLKSLAVLMLAVSGYASAATVSNAIVVQANGDKAQF
jgi:hypothetical protein